jgi:GNAT superfamily N-acetyltransferase
MAKLARVRINQFWEMWKAEGFSSVIKKAVFFNKDVIPAVKDLSVLPPLKSPAAASDIQFVEIREDTFHPDRWKYPSKSRLMRVSKNFKKGYRGFGVVKGGEVVGDIWYCTRGGPGQAVRHPDLEWFAWFGVELGEKDLYMFEMYVKPQERGGGLVNFLHGSALRALREKGFERVYGYCTADNIPALWVHRTLGYKELGRLKMHRLFSLTRRSLKGKPRRVMYRLFDLS